MLNCSVVEVEQELHRGGQRRRSSRRRRPATNRSGTSSSSGSATRFSRGCQRRQHERVELVEDHRQRDDDRRVGRDRQRRHERLGDAEGDRRACHRAAARWRSRAAGRSARSRGAKATAKAATETIRRAAKLVEVLDERQPVLEVDRPHPGHRLAPCCSVTTSPSTGSAGLLAVRRRARLACVELRPAGLVAAFVVVVVVAADERALELADPLAHRRPSSGRRFGPKMISTITSTTAISSGPTLGIVPDVSGRRARRRHRVASP